jgi:hypothetical protein
MPSESVTLTECLTRDKPLGKVLLESEYQLRTDDAATPVVDCKVQECVTQEIPSFKGIPSSTPVKDAEINITKLIYDSSAASL